MCHFPCYLVIQDHSSYERRSTFRRYIFSYPTIGAIQTRLLVIFQILKESLRVPQNIALASWSLLLHAGSIGISCAARHCIFYRINEFLIIRNGSPRCSSTQASFALSPGIRTRATRAYPAIYPDPASRFRLAPRLATASLRSCS